MRALLILVIFSVTACSMRTVPRTGPFQQRTGQLHYTGNGKSVVADIVIRYAGGATEAEISKGPSSRLLSISNLELDSKIVRVSGPLVPIRWKGHPERAPRGLKVFAMLPGAFLSALHEKHTAQFSVEADGARIVCQLNP